MLDTSSPSSGACWKRSGIFYQAYFLFQGACRCRLGVAAVCRGHRLLLSRQRLPWHSIAAHNVEWHEKKKVIRRSQPISGLIATLLLRNGEHNTNTNKSRTPGVVVARGASEAELKIGPIHPAPSCKPQHAPLPSRLMCAPLIMMRDEALPASRVQ